MSEGRTDVELRAGLAQLNRIVRDRLRADTADLLTLTDHEHAGDLLRRYRERSQIDEEAVASRSHTAIVGRRGTGKTSTLIRVYVKLWIEGTKPLFVDVQPISRNRPHQIVAEVLHQFIEDLHEEVPRTKRSLRKAGDALLESLNALRAQGDVTITRGQEAVEERNKERSRSAEVRGGVSHDSGALAGGLGGTSGSRMTTRRTMGSEEQLTSWDVTEALLASIRKYLTQYRRSVGSSPKYIFLDDFYYINRPDQPGILDFFARAFTSLDVWVKLSAVRHRLKSYEQFENSAIGMQTPHDLTEISLDHSLEDYDNTRAFLESVLGELTSSSGLRLRDAITETARDRLVLASGGVPRDYLYLFSSSLDSHMRKQEWKRVSTETVNDKAPSLATQKWQELHADADETDVPLLRQRLGDVHNFCIQDIRQNVFLVEAEALATQEWAKQILALAEFRFLHRIHSTTLKVGSKKYVGVRYQAFVLDLSSYGSTRVRSIDQIDFWKQAGKQAIRKRELVYEPSEPESSPTPAVRGQDQLPFELE